MHKIIFSNNKVFFALLLLSHFAFSQAYNFRNYSVKDGVAQSQVYSLLQDSRGFLWMGTRGGVITKLDGVNFKTFREKAAEINTSSKETYHKSTALLVTQERLDLMH